MIEVKLIVHDAVELNMIAQLQQMIEMKRAQDNARMYEPAPGVPVADQGPVPTVPEELYDDRHSAMGDSEPEPAAEQQRVDLAAEVVVFTAPVPSDIEVARALTEYAQREGVPAARAVLDEFGAKNAMAIPSEQRAAFVARVSA